MTYGRLGIVPRDPARAWAVRHGLGWVLTGRYMNLLRAMRYPGKLPDLDTLAPFGVYAFDLGGALGAAVHAVERFREVGGIPQRPGQASGR